MYIYIYIYIYVHTYKILELIETMVSQSYNLNRPEPKKYSKSDTQDF